MDVSQFSDMQWKGFKFLFEDKQKTINASFAVTSDMQWKGLNILFEDKQKDNKYFILCNL